MKSFHLFVEILLAIIFALIIPIFLNVQYSKIQKNNTKEYEAEKLAWYIKNNEVLSEKYSGAHYIPLSFIKDDCSLSVYNSQYALISFFTEDGNLYIPSEVKYVKLTYGENTEWIIYP